MKLLTILDSDSLVEIMFPFLKYHYTVMHLIGILYITPWGRAFSTFLLAPRTGYNPAAAAVWSDCRELEFYHSHSGHPRFSLCFSGLWLWILYGTCRLQMFAVLFLFSHPQAFCYGAGSSVPMIRYFTSSQRKTLPPPDSQQEKIDFGRYERSASDGCYSQIAYIYRGPYDRGDAQLRPGNGSRSPDMLHASSEPDTQVEESQKTDPGVC